MSDDTDLGPLVNEQGLKNIESIVNSALKAGRAKSVSARHYALYELDRLADTYIQCWERLGW